MLLNSEHQEFCVNTVIFTIPVFANKHFFTILQYTGCVNYL